mmetsp:Transcript_62568/g.136810  ORF Transcript_62568/g.136810 Transcript_62568/m.136810 type:complete len:240 (+) Transcript_62568:98-817(+)
MTIAIWRRFGSLDFAEALGFLDRVDFAAMSNLLSGVALEVAVSVWRRGKHAAGDSSASQRSVRAAEQKAWQQGASLDRGAFPELTWTSGRCGKGIDELQETLRSRKVTAAGEHIVRAAYARLLNGKHQPILDLWRKREFVVQPLLAGAGLSAVRHALQQVRGYTGPSAEGDEEGWGLAFDLLTLTPFSDSPGSVDWSPDYIFWSRQRLAEARAPAMTAAAAQILNRPALSVDLDLVGVG